MSEADFPSPRDLARLAARQGGLLTRGQLARLGGTPDWLYAMLEAGDLIEIEGDVYRHAAHDMHPDDFDRAVWFAADPTAMPEDRLRPDRTPHLVLSGSLALSIRHQSPTGGPVVFACTTLPEDPSPDYDYVVRPVLSGEWEWVRGVPLVKRTFAIADMVLAEDDFDSIRSALIDAILAGDFAASQFLDIVAPATHSWGLDPADGEAVLHRFLPHDVVFTHWTGSTTTISLRGNTLELNSALPIRSNHGGDQ